jgi:hypothetical protein
MSTLSPSDRPVHPDDCAYHCAYHRTRVPATGRWALGPCDRCGAPGVRGLVVLGSPRGVITFIEQDLGLAVPCRASLFAKKSTSATLNMCSRVLVFCASCHPGPESDIVMELGYRRPGDGRWVPTGAVRPMDI